MQPNATEFVWTKKREQAAALVADDQLADREIAQSIGVNKVTLERWKQHPSFRARVDALVEDVRLALRAKGISDKANRVAALDDRWRRMQRVIDERAADESYADVPGWKTGLLVHQRKKIGHGEDSEVVDEFVVDVGLLRELRAHEEQAAKELGQWVERSGLDVRILIARMADELGLTEDEREEAVKEAQRVLTEAKRGSR